MNLPEGWKLVPVELTAENGMKAALMGEFHVPFPERDEDGNEHICKVNVPWTVIKQIHRAVVAAAPTPPAQEDEPVGFRWRKKTTPDRWHLCRIELLDDAEEGNVETELLYTRPQSDDLRQAADRLLNAVVNDAVMRNVLDREFWNATDNLRAALERK